MQNLLYQRFQTIICVSCLLMNSLKLRKIQLLLNCLLNLPKGVRENIVLEIGPP